MNLFVGCLRNMAEFVGVLVHRKPTSIELHDFVGKWVSEREFGNGGLWRASSEPIDVDSVSDLLSFLSGKYVEEINLFSEFDSRNGFLEHRFDKAKTDIRDIAALAVECGVGMDPENAVLSFVLKVREETRFGGLLKISA